MKYIIIKKLLTISITGISLLLISFSLINKVEAVPAAKITSPEINSIGEEILIEFKDITIPKLRDTFGIRIDGLLKGDRPTYELVEPAYGMFDIYVGFVNAELEQAIKELGGNIDLVNNKWESEMRKEATLDQERVRLALDIIVEADAELERVRMMVETYRKINKELESFTDLTAKLMKVVSSMQAKIPCSCLSCT